MVLGNPLLRTDVTEHVQLLLVFSAHAFFLSGCAVETREFRGTASASNRVFPQPARADQSFQALKRHFWFSVYIDGVEVVDCDLLADIAAGVPTRLSM